MVREARGGGSVPPEGLDLLAQSMKTYPIDVREETEVWDAVPSTAEGSGKLVWSLDLSDGSKLECNRMWLATGTQLDLNALRFLDEVKRCFPVEVVGGLPVLADSLKWSEGCDLYMMGAYAALQLGPDALNLAGARSGAARIAHDIHVSLSPQDFYRP
eukprot:scaffold40_cov413-Prasinococcus_capsulatus_cf.AAC.1